MRQLILTAVSAIALGVAGAGIGHAQNYGNPANPSATIPGSAAPQTNQPQAQTEPQAQTGPQEQAAPAEASLSRSQIRKAQEQLRAQGICRCRADGKLGPQTKAALRRFQQRNNLPQTATLDRQTMDALMGGGTATGSSAPPTVLRGSAGAFRSGAGGNGSPNPTGQPNQKY
jgi:peptidoglycan hydrolase-like protein with peptidoglycan-binding domain